MSSRDIKKMLANSLRREDELIDFAYECIAEIFGKDSDEAKHIWDLFLDDYNDTIQSLSMLKHNIEVEKKHRSKQKEETK